MNVSLSKYGHPAGANTSVYSFCPMPAHHCWWVSRADSAPLRCVDLHKENVPQELYPGLVPKRT